MIFRMSFLIIHRNDSTACLYSKSFMLLRFVCDSFEKKLCHSMSAFFWIVRAMHHLKQLLNCVVVSEWHCIWFWFFKFRLEKLFWSESRELTALSVVLKQQHCLVLLICLYKDEMMNNFDDRWLFFLIQHASFQMFFFSVAALCMFLQNWTVLTLWMTFFLIWFRTWIFSVEICWWWVIQIWCTTFWTSWIHHLQLYFEVSLNHDTVFSISWLMNSNR